MNRQDHEDGSTYTGEYKNDKLDGYGEYALISGERYVGEWENDKLEWRKGVDAYGRGYEERQLSMQNILWYTHALEKLENIRTKVEQIEECVVAYERVVAYNKEKIAKSQASNEGHGRTTSSWFVNTWKSITKSFTSCFGQPQERGHEPQERGHESQERGHEPQELGRESSEERLALNDHYNRNSSELNLSFDNIGGNEFGQIGAASKKEVKPKNNRLNCFNSKKNRVGVGK